jgi:PAS domain S-box-containing protein
MPLNSLDSSRNRIFLALQLLLVSTLALSPFVSTVEAQEQQIIVGVLENWPPQYSTDPKTNQPTGFAVDIINEISRSNNLNIQYKVFREWPILQKALMKKEIDVIPDMGIIAERKALFRYTAPTETTKILFFVRETSSDIKTVADLSGRSVSVVETNKGQFLMEQKGWKDLRIYQSFEEALMSVISGVSDAIVYPNPPMWNILEQYGMSEKFKTIGEPLLEVKRAIVVHKDNVDLHKMLDDSVKKLLVTDKYTSIYQKWFKSPPTFWTISKIIFLMCGLLAFVSASLLFWRFMSVTRLNKKLIKKETKLQGTLKELNRFEYIVSSSIDMMALLDDKYMYLTANEAYINAFGKTKVEIVGHTVTEVLGEDFFENVMRSKAESCLAGKYINYENWFDFPSTGHLYMNISYFPYRDEANEIVGFVVVARDLSDRKKAEEETKNLENRLQQAQKMEAIGTLAGGIAHDFNNILSAIIGYTEMARDDSPDESSIAKDLDNVLEASTRAVGLVKQILSFSRQDETENVLLQPTSIVNKAIAMLRPTLPTTIEITQDIDTKTGLVFADPTQIHQILMNLCTNAFHAMEETGGNLDISLKEIDLRREDINPALHIEAGTFIQISVGDSGAGMTQQVKDKIFDPYFTTKGVGKGTGMGLSIVHGIVKSYGGLITLSSELNKGTTFNIFLPVANNEELPDKETIKQIPVGIEKVLFIDDEDVLADMGKNMLERLGYHVTVRKSSLEALETFQNQPDQFDVVITDQTMPGMTGVDLARRMLQIRPDMPIILCTGYSSTISEAKAKSFGIREFALKPVGKRDIAMLVRKVLDGNQA